MKRAVSLLVLVALVFAGCDENAPIIVKRVDRDHFLVYDPDGWNPTAALDRTCPAIRRSIRYYVTPQRHQNDALTVVCGP